MSQQHSVQKFDQNKKNGQISQKAPPVKTPAPAESTVIVDKNRPLTSAEILHLQRTIGNRATSRIVQRQSSFMEQKKIRRKKASHRTIQRTPADEIQNENKHQPESAEDAERADHFHAVADTPSKLAVQRTAEDEDIRGYRSVPTAETATPSHAIQQRVDRAPQEDEEREQQPVPTQLDLLVNHLGNMPPALQAAAGGAGLGGEVQRAPTFAGTYTGANQGKAQQALDWAIEDTEKSGGDRAKDFGKDFGTSLVGILGGPLVYAIPHKRNKLKEDWAKADNVLAYGTGGWGSFVRVAKRTNIVLGEIASMISWVSLLFMLAAPFTAGVSAVIGAAIGAAAGGINAVMAALNLIIMIGQAVRMSQLPKNSIEYAMAYRALADETGQFVGNTVGAVLGLLGAGSVSKAGTEMTETLAKEGLKGVFKGIGTDLAKNTGAGTATQAYGAGLNAIAQSGSSSSLRDAKKTLAEQDKGTIQPATDGAELQNQLTILETLDQNLVGDSTQMNDSAKKAEGDFDSMSSKADEAPTDKLAAVESQSGAVAGLTGKAVSTAQSMGDDKNKIKAMQQKVDAAGQKVGVSVKISAPEPNEEEFKAAKGGGQVNRMADISRVTEAPIQRGFWSKIKKGFEKVGSAIAGGASKVWGGIKAGASAIADFAKKAFSKVKQWIMAAVKAITDAVLAIIKKAIAAFKKLLAQIKAAIQMFRNIFSATKENKAQAKQASQLHAQNQQRSSQVSSQIKQLISKVKEKRTSDDKDAA